MLASSRRWQCSKWSGSSRLLTSPRNPQWSPQNRMAKRRGIVPDALSQVEPVGLPKLVKPARSSPVTLSIGDVAERASRHPGHFRDGFLIEAQFVHYLNENGNLCVSALCHRSLFVFSPPEGRFRQRQAQGGGCADVGASDRNRNRSGFCVKTEVESVMIRDSIVPPTTR